MPGLPFTLADPEHHKASIEEKHKEPVVVINEKKDDGPINGGHRFAVSINPIDSYHFADAIKIDPLTGFPEWYCVYPTYNLYGIQKEDYTLYDYKPEISIDEFRSINPERLVK